MVAIAIVVAALAFVGYRLYKTDMVVPESAERALGARDALRFALDHKLPINPEISV